jgi:hypothetical protein
MKCRSVAEIARQWNLSERTVRNCCAAGKISEAFLTGKTWNIPENAQRPVRSNRHDDAPKTLLECLRLEVIAKVNGGNREYCATIHLDDFSRRYWQSVIE